MQTRAYLVAETVEKAMRSVGLMMMAMEVSVDLVESMIGASGGTGSVQIRDHQFILDTLYIIDKHTSR